MHELYGRDVEVYNFSNGTWCVVDEAATGNSV